MRKEEFMESGERKFIFTLPYKLLVVVLVIFFAFYVGSVLFGTRSLTELLKLSKEEKNLKLDIKKSKNENQKLQKKLFEYEVLVPDENSN